LFNDFSESCLQTRKEPAMPIRLRYPLSGLALGGLMAAGVVTGGAALAQSEAIPLPQQRLFPLPNATLAARRLRQLDLAERDLRAARDAHALCRDTACATPAETAALAFQAGPEQPLKGRFILDVRSATGPGNRFKPPGSDEFYLASERDPRLYGTIVVAIAPAAMEGLLNPGTAEAEARVRPTSGRLRAAFSGQRVIVDGEASLQWVDWPDWETGQRNGMGQYQVWVRVTSPDQIRLVEE
jgi:hypothetical protein